MRKGVINESILHPSIKYNINIMGWEEEFFGFLAIHAADKAVEKSENQLTFVNFIVQAKKLGILTYKKGCEKGASNQPLDKPSISEKDSYLYLYDI